jgi:hypothetical protein
MPFYFRKSVKAGPFRFNFSKGGVGVSVGVKGLRFGTGPRGHYVHAGAHGIYYRASLGRAGDRGRRPAFASDTFHQITDYDSDGVEMIEVESADVMAMQPETFGQLLGEINSKRQQISLAVLFPIIAIGLGVFALLISASAAVLLLLAVPAWLVGKWLDSYRKVVVLFYELDDEFAAKFAAVTAQFDVLSSVSAKWHVEAGGQVRDLTTWKRNAGASHIVRKKPTLLNYALPQVIKSNVTPPAIRVGRQTLYFLPDVMLVDDGSRVGAVSYEQLCITYQDSNFIEEGPVPRDTQVIGRTWKHPNKSGGPDRRFANNYQIPICRYEAIHFGSATGLNELIEISRNGVSAPFAQSVKALSTHSIDTRAALPLLY